MEQQEHSGSGRGADKRHRRHHRHKHKIVGRKLKQYLLMLNIALSAYLSYAVFYAIMRERCGLSETCFLNTNTNHLLTMLAAGCFLAHLIISASTFIQHRDIKSKRLIVHQVIAVIAVMVVLLLGMFLGFDSIVDALSQVRIE